VVPLLLALGLATFGAISLHRTWHTTNTRLNRLATLIIHDDTRRERASTANEYLCTLRGFESATTKDQRANTERRLSALEQAATER
jgi:hypothetical protein